MTQNWLTKRQLERLGNDDGNVDATSTGSLQLPRDITAHDFGAVDVLVVADPTSFSLFWRPVDNANKIMDIAASTTTICQSGDLQKFFKLSLIISVSSDRERLSFE